VSASHRPTTCCFLTAVLRVNETGGPVRLSGDKAKGELRELRLLVGRERGEGLFLRLCRRGKVGNIVCMYLWLS